LHFGQKGQTWLWPNYREDFLEDLARIHPRSGPWGAIVFTGDLAYSGKSTEFAELTIALQQVMGRIGELQETTPVFLAVPGNHDLSRPVKSPTLVAFSHWWDHEDVRDEFWDNPGSDYRRITSESHSGYSDWMGSNGFARPDEYLAGELPGDFSAVITNNGICVGFAGLNSTFLQLAGGDYAGKLDLHPRQLSAACGGDHAGWIAGNHASVLLTHQPPDWLHPAARRLYDGAIYPSRSFVAHFYGHMHEASANVISLGMGATRRQLQGCSLYGLEYFGEAFDRERFKFGYTAVRMSFEGERGQLILWPRAAVLKQSREWRLGPDQGYELVDGAEHTPAVEFPLKVACDGRTSVRVPMDQGQTPPYCDCPESRNARFILQFCSDGLPAEVLAGALRLPPERLRSLLGGCLDETAFREHGEFKLAAGFSESVVVGDAGEVIGRALEMLLGYIGNHKSDGLGAKCVDSAIALAKRCKDARPTVVAGLFDTVDRMLKRRGDKHKVLEAATLTIEAAKHPLRSEEDVRREARALICGKSWVLQRIGRLAEAMAGAETSLDLGQRINWERNTAFCNKCMGRIYRMQAEQEADEGKRRELIRRSIDSLRAAVGVFKDLAEIGPDHPEVGDCYSLVARTFLVAGQLREARTYLTKAEARLQDRTDKDYFDYLILEGDYAAAKGDHEGAQAFYDQVIGVADAGDCEKSEIRARALFRRGESRVARGMTAAALADFEGATKSWDGLGERKAAAKARWRGIVVGKKLSTRSISHLEGDSDTVKVIAFQLHQAKLSTLQTKGPRRSEPDKRYWQFILREARELDAKQDLEW
jgi:tetratricopeptide (TPR) repeat protein